eukprot:366281-Chlamydomonas_euryale.AAC.6
MRSRRGRIHAKRRRFGHPTSHTASHTPTPPVRLVSDRCRCGDVRRANAAAELHSGWTEGRAGVSGVRRQIGRWYGGWDGGGRSMPSVPQGYVPAVRHKLRAQLLP